MESNIKRKEKEAKNYGGSKKKEGEKKRGLKKNNNQRGIKYISIQISNQITSYSLKD